MNPYTNLTEGKEVIREFSADVDPMSLIWHEDQEDRTIKVLKGSGWKFQFDEDLPFEMITGDEFKIPRGYLHRVIKGNGNLKIKIIKNEHTRVI
jgi:quercetin dioxygenase-like cupin family protein